MAWIDIPDSILDSESEIRDFTTNSSIFQQIDDCITAWRQGLAGAPQLTGAAWADNSFNADRFNSASFTGNLFADESIGSGNAIANSAVRQNHLKTTFGAITLLTGAQLVINPASYQMIGYESRFLATPVGTEWYRFSFPGVHATTDASAVVASAIYNQGLNLESYIWMDVSTPPGMEINLYFISASPPYEIGGRQAHTFCYIRQAADGRPKSIWNCPAPPWANNGPTSTLSDIRLDGIKYQIKPKNMPYSDPGVDPHKLRANIAAIRKARADLAYKKQIFDAAQAEVKDAYAAGMIDRDFVTLFESNIKKDYRATLESIYDLCELTPERKNADAHLYPQPYGPNPRAASIGTDRIIILDPTERMAEDLAILHDAGESIGELVANDYLRIGDDLAGAPAPIGITPVDLVWKDSAI